ncbi:MAG TPA: endonuclease VIII, partial [Candidatus Poseidoniaceae archaeon]
MPEGPEIHRAADRLRKALVGKTLLEVQAEHPAIAGRLDGWVGREVESVDARSKAMLIRVGD